MAATTSAASAGQGHDREDIRSQKSHASSHSSRSAGSAVQSAAIAASGVIPGGSVNQDSDDVDVLMAVKIKGGAGGGVDATPPIMGHQRRNFQRNVPELTSEGSGGEQNSGVEAMAMERLWHSSDLAVKPIMLNRRIEKIAEPTYDPRQLSVPHLSAETLLAGNVDRVERFIGAVIASLSQNLSSQADKVNTLRFLETLCTNSEAANLLTNSALMHFLVKLLRTQRPAVSVRVQVISVVGLLIRHATVIHADLANTGLVSVLSECLRDKQEKVRRRAMASLGELIFYIATQGRVPGSSEQGETGLESGWQVPSTTFALIGSLLRRGEDEIAQHYAVKTIENVSSEGGEWASRFCSNENLANLCTIYRHSTAKQEHLKLTAGSCLVRLVRFAPGWTAAVAEKIGIKELVGGLARGNPKEQQIHLSLMGMVLCAWGSSHSGSHASLGKMGQQVAEDRALIPTLCALLEHSADILRGKASVCAALALNISRRSLASFCASKMLPAVERLGTREQDEFARQGVELLVAVVASCAGSVMAGALGDLEASGGSTGGFKGRVMGSPVSGNQSPAAGGKLFHKGSMALFPALLHLVSSPLFRPKVVNEAFIVQLAALVEQLSQGGIQPPQAGGEDFPSVVMSVLGALVKDRETLLSYRRAIQTRLLPNLVTLRLRSSSGDLRFLALKIISDYLTIFLENDSPAGGAPAGEDYASGGEGREEEEAEGSGGDKRLLRRFVKNHLFAMYPQVMEEEEPTPTYGQKLIITLLEHDIITVGDVSERDLTQMFFSLLCGELSAVNVHTLRLCLVLGLNPGLETEVLSSLQVVAKLGALLEEVYDQRMEDFLEPLLSLCLLFLQRDKECRDGQGIEDISDFCEHSDLFLELMGMEEPQVAETAGECLSLVIRVSPKEASYGLLRNPALFADLLGKPASGHSGELVARLRWQLMQSLGCALSMQRKNQLLDFGEVVEGFEPVMQVVEGLRQLSDRPLAKMANDILQEYRQL